MGRVEPDDGEARRSLGERATSAGDETTALAWDELGIEIAGDDVEEGEAPTRRRGELKGEEEGGGNAFDDVGAPGLLLGAWLGMAIVNGWAENGFCREAGKEGRRGARAEASCSDSSAAFTEASNARFSACSRSCLLRSWVKSNGGDLSCTTEGTREAPVLRDSPSRLCGRPRGISSPPLAVLGANMPNKRSELGIGPHEGDAGATES